MKVFRIEFTGRIDDRGVGSWTSIGDPIEIDGQPHVRLQHGAIVPRGDGWSDTLEEAKTIAAENIERIMVVLANQASALREEAARARVAPAG